MPDDSRGFAKSSAQRRPDILRLPGLDTLWARTLGHPDVCIAVLDGPVDLSHPCLAGTRLRQIETLVPGKAGTGPASLHGTHVASVIFGAHGSSVEGIAPGCRGLIVPVFKDGDGEGLAPCSQLDLARAITQAVAHGAHIINISGGQFDPSGEAHPYLTEAVRACKQSGTLIIAAAGNEGCECLHVPAALSSVLAVGAMGTDGVPLQFSNWGGAYQANGILAPGEKVQGAVPGGGVVERSGTSYATPIVSGVVALLLSVQVRRGGSLDPYAAKEAILGGAIGCDEEPIPNCDRLLAGRLSIVGSLEYVNQGVEMDMAESNENREMESVEPGGAGDPKPVENAMAAEVGASQLPTVDPTAAPPACGVPVSLSAPSPQEELSQSTGRISPSATGGAPGFVFAIGQIGCDFGSEARHDSFVQMGIANPRDPALLLQFLAANPAHAAGVTWTLVQEATPIYAIQPFGPFAHESYAMIREFVNDQVAGEVELVSLPGTVSGSTRLLGGQVVPVIVPDIRGMYSWNVKALVEAVLGRRPAARSGKREAHDEQAADIVNFLRRIYYELRNLGISPQERAINYGATNLRTVAEIFGKEIEAGRKLDTIGVERSPICRPESDCWDVMLTFFNPAKRQEEGRHVYRFTVDVSDVVPVTVGEIRNWSVY